jgi:DNA-binding NtrC family response regulator
MKTAPLVLHLDDDPSILRLVACELQRCGYQVVSVEEPGDLPRVLVETNARVVLLDVNLPGVDGLQLLRQIKLHDGSVQVILLTGVVSITTVLQAMRWGAEGCVFKPVKDMARLDNLLRACFAKVDAWSDALHELTARHPATHRAVPASQVAAYADSASGASSARRPLGGEF